MDKVNWIEILGWSQNEVNDLRLTAYAYIQQGSYKIALTLFEGVLVLAPPTAYDLQTIGALHLQMGNGLQALEFLEKALQLEPNHLPTQLNRAKAMMLLGYKRQALAQVTALEKCGQADIATQASALHLSNLSK